MPAPLQPPTVLGRAIRKARKEKGFSRQADLAAAMHIHQGTVSSWELGESRPDAPLMLLLHDLIGVPLDVYFADLDLEALRTGSMSDEETGLVAAV